ncbi:MAG: hypothetical protein CMJ16_04495 [Peredibacter sp.]|nr:hypothetical protein [Peredibacter sp.]
MTIVNDQDAIDKLNKTVDEELAIALNTLGDKQLNQINELIQMKNSGKLKFKYFSNINSRGMQNSDDACDCSTIFLNKDYIDTGVVSTLIHEFEHLKHELLLGEEFFNDNPEIDKLTSIFGDFYFGGSNNQIKNPRFNEALYVGSAFLFYTEFRAFKEQVDAINAGVKDTVRPERSVADIIETIANDYFINRGIQVNSEYAIYLAELSYSLTPKEFLLSIYGNKRLKNYFEALQEVRS